MYIYIVKKKCKKKNKYTASFVFLHCVFLPCWAFTLKSVSKPVVFSRTWFVFSGRNPFASFCSLGKPTECPATPFWLLKASAGHVSKYAHAERFCDSLRIRDRRKVCIAMGLQRPYASFFCSNSHRSKSREKMFLSSQKPVSPGSLIGSLHAHLASDDPKAPARVKVKAGQVQFCFAPLHLVFKLVEALRAGVLTNCCSLWQKFVVSQALSKTPKLFF